MKYKAIITIATKMFTEDDNNMLQPVTGLPPFHKTFAVSGNTEEECQANLDKFLGNTLETLQEKKHGHEKHL